MCQNHPVVAVAEFVKLYLIPGSVWFLIIVGSLGVLLLSSDRTRRSGRALLAGLFLLYWVMSIPLVAHGLQLAQRLRQPRPAIGAALTGETLPIVVLGNGLGGYAARGARFELPLGQTAMNTLFAVERYRQTPGALVIASGGPQPGVEDGAPEAAVIRDGLLRNGVPPDRIVLEPRSNNTRDQAEEVSKILRSRGENRCVVITSPQQMPRAIDLFRVQGITVVPLPAGALLWEPSDEPHWYSWVVPTTEARAVSRDVFYELVAWPYYRARGWVH
jgi:uncharacterized SAM-binding protein YcdF (DUF218 family)